MGWSKFEYCLIAFHYSIWKSNIRSRGRFERMFMFIFAPLLNLLPKKIRYKYIRWKLSQKEKEDIYFNDIKNGVHMQETDWLFNTIFSCYFLFISFILMGLFTRLGIKESYIIYGVSMIPMLFEIILSYRIIYSKDKYLKYYRKFEKEKPSWHKRWRLRKNIFCLGGIVMAALGVVMMIIIG